ncbi:hypothetical protein [Streptomyces sp. NPDC001404]|uniref:hypothetical protein n=1 Tax=Streptomyces sp. NPDC001404 TaxID=3364571 RepID=UPI0036B2242E
MANWHDLAEDELIARLVIVYSRIAAACALFPVPYNLPTARPGATVGEFFEGVAHLSNISDEIPDIPKDVAAALDTSCTYWVAASDVLALHIAQPNKCRARAFGLCLTGAEVHLNDVVDWLAQDAS